MAALLFGLTGCQYNAGTPVDPGTTVPTGFAVWTNDTLPQPALSQSLPDTSVLGGPHFDLQVNYSTAVPQLKAAEVLQLHHSTRYVDPVVKATEGPLLPAQGQELLLVRLGHNSALVNAFPAGATPVHGRVVTADATTGLTTFVPNGGLLIVAVPTGGPATLVVTDAGRDQSIDLRTGQPGADAIAAYDRPAPTGKDTAGFDAFLQPGNLYSGLTVRAEAVLRPHYETSAGDGVAYASRGRSWLQLIVTVELDPYGHALSGYFDNAKSFDVEADGAAATVVPGNGGMLPADGQSGPSRELQFVLRYDVAPSARTVTVAVHPRGGAFLCDGKPCTISPVKPVSLDITLS